MVELSAKTRKTVVGGFVEFEGNVAYTRGPPGREEFVGSPY